MLSMTTLACAAVLPDSTKTVMNLTDKYEMERAFIWVFIWRLEGQGGRVAHAGTEVTDAGELDFCHIVGATA